MRLSPAVLSTLGVGNPSSTPIGVPKYEREEVASGILHFGVGNFQRGHLSHYLEELLNTESIPWEERKPWGLLGAGVMGRGAARREDLEPQDWMYTLVARDADTVTPRIMGNMIDFLPVEEDNEAVKESLMNPDIKIVSLTVTEGGYYLNPATMGFDAMHPQMIADAENPDDPKTAFGLIIQALKGRKEKGMKPFAVLSCDNLPENGDKTKGTIVGLAKMMDKELGDWISDNVSFPNGMVDRICPSTSEMELAYVKETYGFEDKSPVFCEPFTQWVLEDKFPNGRPQLEKVGVQFVEDVHPYENAKIRILNGGHASLCYPSALLDVDYVHEAMEHPVIGPFLNTLERHEIIPTVDPVPDTDLVEYWETIANRFSNPTIYDTIPRNCASGSDRQPKFIIPPLRVAIEQGTPMEGLAMVSALWCRYCQGTTESGKTIEPNDPKWDILNETALKAKEDPSVWCEMTDIYGKVGTNKQFVSSFSSALNMICDEGVEAAMKAYTEKTATAETTKSAAAA